MGSINHDENMRFSPPHTQDAENANLSPHIPTTWEEQLYPSPVDIFASGAAIAPNEREIVSRYHLSAVTDWPRRLAANEMPADPLHI